MVLKKITAQIAQAIAGSVKNKLSKARSEECYADPLLQDKLATAHMQAATAYLNSGTVSDDPDKVRAYLRDMKDSLLVLAEVDTAIRPHVYNILISVEGILRVLVEDDTNSGKLLCKAANHLAKVSNKYA